MGLEKLQSQVYHARLNTRTLTLRQCSALTNEDRGFDHLHQLVDLHQEANGDLNVGPVDSPLAGRSLSERKIDYGH